MIKIEQLLPLLRKGWVAMDSDGYWYYHKEKPALRMRTEKDGCWGYGVDGLSDAFSIRKVKDWTKSLMRCGDE